MRRHRAAGVLTGGFILSASRAMVLQVPQTLPGTKRKQLFSLTISAPPLQIHLREDHIVRIGFRDLCLGQCVQFAALGNLLR